MDHFARPAGSDHRLEEGRLHRNFMGIPPNARRCPGTGCVQYQRMPVAFAQNEKALHDYYAAVHAGNLPFSAAIS